jgi:hypothetical protein
VENAPKVEKTEPVKSKVLESFKPKADKIEEMVIRPAERSVARARIGMGGPAGAGKTASALLMAFGLCADWSRIIVIDTEHGSGHLYTGATIPKTGGVKIGRYNVLSLEAPYAPEKFLTAIKMAEDAKTSTGDRAFDVVIIDSFSQFWSGPGGLLEAHSKEADRIGNSWSAWGKITPKHNQMIEAFLKSPLHVIITARSKQEHTQEKDSKTGKSVIKRVGMEPEVRKGLEYEVTTWAELAIDHVAFFTKDRSNLFDQAYAVITPEHGQQIGKWLQEKT